MIKKTKNFMYKLMQPNSGVSSKRFISIGGFVIMCFIALVDLFTNLTVSDYVFEGLAFITIAATSAVAAEAFANRGKGNFIQQIPNQQMPEGYVEPSPPQTK